MFVRHTATGPALILAALSLISADRIDAQVRESGAENSSGGFPQSSPSQPDTASPIFSRPSYFDLVTTSDHLHFAVTGTFMYGRVDGYAQIPAGGEPGSTSSKRPRFSELGIHDAAIGAGEISA